MSPIGYVCSTCRRFLPDEPPVMTLADLRPAVEAVASEVTNLLQDRQVHERFAGIVRGNQTLLTAVQTGNPFLQGVRRWWATSAALLLRRHVDGGSSNTLRDVLEALVDLPDGELTRPRETFNEDLQQLEKISERFRPYLNNLIHGSGNSPSPSLTFNDLNEAIDALRDIAQRAYSAVANVSRQMEPVIVFDWTKIFEEAWIQEKTPMAYVLGEPGVPFDAVPMTELDSRNQARLEIHVKRMSDDSAEVTVTNVGQHEALDVRLFLPYAGTAIDVPEISVQEVARCVIQPPFSSSVIGQAVMEFSDTYDRVYRQYADVDLNASRVRRLSPIPFRVSGRIVSGSAFAGAP